MVSPCTSGWPEFCYITYIVYTLEISYLRFLNEEDRPKTSSMTQETMLIPIFQTYLCVLVFCLQAYMCSTYMPVSHRYQMIISVTLDLESHKENTHGNLYQRFFQRKQPEVRTTLANEQKGEVEMLVLQGHTCIVLKIICG